MELLILSELNMIKQVDSLTKNTAIISIFHPKSIKIQLSSKPFVKGQFIMSFHDADIGEAYHTGLTPPKQKNFNGLKLFIDTIKNDVEQFIVHCPGGISRSAGVGAAICEYLNIDNSIWTTRIYHPNLLVYKLACNELGITKTQKEMDKAFEARNKFSMFHDNDLDLYYERYRKRNKKNILSSR